MTDDTKIAAMTSICAILLREVRMERNLHQAQIADWIGKTPSAWTKIEAGKSPLQFETFIRACQCLNVLTSTVMATAERYAGLLSQNGWAILASEQSLEEDKLIRLAQDYWASPGGKNQISLTQVSSRWGFTSVLNGPTYDSHGFINLAPVFRFALDEEFRDLQLNPPATGPGDY